LDVTLQLKKETEMTEPTQETGQDQQEQAVMDRRSAAKAIGKYAAYTAPAMAVLLNADDAEAFWWRRRQQWRRNRWVNYKKGSKPGPS